MAALAPRKIASSDYTIKNLQVSTENIPVNTIAITISMSIAAVLMQSSGFQGGVGQLTEHGISVLLSESC